MCDTLCAVHCASSMHTWDVYVEYSVQYTLGAEHNAWHTCSAQCVSSNTLHCMCVMHCALHVCIAHCTMSHNHVWCSWYTSLSYAVLYMRAVHTVCTHSACTHSVYVCNTLHIVSACTLYAVHSVLYSALLMQCFTCVQCTLCVHALCVHTVRVHTLCVCLCVWYTAHCISHSAQCIIQTHYCLYIVHCL